MADTNQMAGVMDERIADAIQRRLGPGEFATTCDVAAAANVSMDTVRGWISARHVQAVNVARVGRPIWRIHVASVIEFYLRRSAGADEAIMEGRES